MALNTQPTPGLTAIKQAAAANGLDWRPLASIAHYESGLNPSSVGDNGTSFGLFQLHQGGALPSGTDPNLAKNAQWNANFAARQIKSLGITGLPLNQQVAQISRRFERPADPAKEIAGAQSYLATLGRGTNAAAPGYPATLAAGTTAVPTQSLPSLSLAPLQSSLDLGQQSSQRALDALGKLSGHSIEAAAAPDLSQLLAQQQSTQVAAKPATLKVPLTGKTPAGLDPQETKAVELAKTYLGDKYVFGGSSHAGIDCSGLIANIYSKLGINLPHNAAAQYHLGKPVAEKDLQPGDAVYFQTEGAKAGVTHVALFIGNGKVLEAPHTGAVVHITPLAGYLQQHLVGARRFA